MHAGESVVVSPGLTNDEWDVSEEGNALGIGQGKGGILSVRWGSETSHCVGLDLLDRMEVSPTEKLAAAGAAHGGIHVESIQRHATIAQGLGGERHGLHAVEQQVLVIGQHEDKIGER